MTAAKILASPRAFADAVDCRQLSGLDRRVVDRARAQDPDGDTAELTKLT